MQSKRRLTGNDLSYVQTNYLATQSGLDIDKIKTLNIVGTVNSKQKLIIVLLKKATPITPLRPLAADEIAEIITSTTLRTRSKCLNESQATNLAVESGLPIDIIKTLPIKGSVRETLIVVVKNTKIQITPERQLAEGEAAEIVSSSTLKEKISHLTEKQIKYLAENSGLPAESIEALKVVGKIKAKLTVVSENTAIPITRERPLAAGEKAEIVCRFTLLKRTHTLTEYQVNYLAENSGLSAESIKALKIVGDLNKSLTVVVQNTATPITRERPLADGESAEIICKITLEYRTHTLTKYQVNYLAENSGLPAEIIKALKIVGKSNSRLIVVLQNTTIPITLARPLANGEIAEIISASILRKRAPRSTTAREVENGWKEADDISIKKSYPNKMHYVLDDLLECISVNFKRFFDDSKQVFHFEVKQTSLRNKYVRQLRSLSDIYLPEINDKKNEIINCNGNLHLTVSYPFLFSLCSNIDELLKTKYTHQLISLPKDSVALSTVLSSFESSNCIRTLQNFSSKKMKSIINYNFSEENEELILRFSTYWNAASFAVSFNKLGSYYRSQPDCLVQADYIERHKTIVTLKINWLKSIYSHFNLTADLDNLLHFAQSDMEIESRLGGATLKSLLLSLWRRNSWHQYIHCQDLFPDINYILLTVRPNLKNELTHLLRISSSLINLFFEANVGDIKLNKNGNIINSHNIFTRVGSQFKIKKESFKQLVDYFSLNDEINIDAITPAPIERTPSLNNKKYFFKYGEDNDVAFVFCSSTYISVYLYALLANVRAMTLDLYASELDKFDILQLKSENQQHWILISNFGYFWEAYQLYLRDNDYPEIIIPSDNVDLNEITPDNLQVLGGEKVSIEQCDIELATVASLLKFHKNRELLLAPVIPTRYQQENDFAEKLLRLDDSHMNDSTEDYLDTYMELIGEFENNIEQTDSPLIDDISTEASSEINQYPPHEMFYEPLVLLHPAAIDQVTYTSPLMTTVETVEESGNAFIDSPSSGNFTDADFDANEMPQEIEALECAADFDTFNDYDANHFVATFFEQDILDQETSIDPALNIKNERPILEISPKEYFLITRSLEYWLRQDTEASRQYFDIIEKGINFDIQYRKNTLNPIDLLLNKQGRQSLSCIKLALKYANSITAKRYFRLLQNYALSDWGRENFRPTLLMKLSEIDDSAPLIYDVFKDFSNNATDFFILLESLLDDAKEGNAFKPFLAQMLLQSHSVKLLNPIHQLLLKGKIWLIKRYFNLIWRLLEDETLQFDGIFFREYYARSLIYQHGKIYSPFMNALIANAYNAQCYFNELKKIVEIQHSFSYPDGYQIEFQNICIEQLLEPYRYIYSPFNKFLGGNRNNPDKYNYEVACHYFDFIEWFADSNEMFKKALTQVICAFNKESCTLFHQVRFCKYPEISQRFFSLLSKLINEKGLKIIIDGKETSFSDGILLCLLSSNIKGMNSLQTLLQNAIPDVAKEYFDFLIFMFKEEAINYEQLNNLINVKTKRGKSILSYACFDHNILQLFVNFLKAVNHNFLIQEILSIMPIKFILEETSPKTDIYFTVLESTIEKPIYIDNNEINPANFMLDKQQEKHLDPLRIALNNDIEVNSIRYFKLLSQFAASRLHGATFTPRLFNALCSTFNKTKLIYDIFLKYQKYGHFYFDLFEQLLHADPHNSAFKSQLLEELLFVNQQTTPIHELLKNDIHGLGRRYFKLINLLLDNTPPTQKRVSKKIYAQALLMQNVYGKSPIIEALSAANHENTHYYFNELKKIAVDPEIMLELVSGYKTTFKFLLITELLEPFNLKGSRVFKLINAGTPKVAASYFELLDDLCKIENIDSTEMSFKEATALAMLAEDKTGSTCMEDVLKSKKPNITGLYFNLVIKLLNEVGLKITFHDEKISFKEILINQLFLLNQYGYNSLHNMLIYSDANTAEHYFNTLLVLIERTPNNEWLAKLINKPAGNGLTSFDIAASSSYTALKTFIDFLVKAKIEDQQIIYGLTHGKYGNVTARPGSRDEKAINGFLESKCRHYQMKKRKREDDYIGLLDERDPKRPRTSHSFFAVPTSNEISTKKAYESSETKDFYLFSKNP